MLVLMTMLAVAAAGIFLGLRYKAPALIAATGLLAIGGFGWNSWVFPGSVTIPNFLVLVFTLACAYLVGISLSVAWKRNEGNSR